MFSYDYPILSLLHVLFVHYMADCFTILNTYNMRLFFLSLLKLCIIVYLPYREWSGPQ